MLLTDRLGGSSGGIAANANFVIESLVDGTGKKQLSSRRLSDGQVALLTSTGNNIQPTIDLNDKVLYYSDLTSQYMWLPANGGTPYPVDPVRTFVAFGDSLTAGAGGTGGGFPTLLAAALGRTVINKGIGGEYSTEIAPRQGAVPLQLTFTGNQIIAGTAATALASWPANTFPVVSNGSTITGTAAGVPMTLTITAVDSNNRATAATYTRTTAGSVVAAPPNTPFIADDAVTYQSWTQILQWGRNNYTNPTQVKSDIANAILWMKPYAKRYLIGGILLAVTELGTSNQTILNQLNADLAALYGSRFVDINAVPTTAEMAAIGFTPGSYGTYSNGRTDAQDLAAGIVPSGMRNFAGGDYLHGNDFYYKLTTNRYLAPIIAKGW